MLPNIIYKYFPFSGGLVTLENASLRYRHPNEFNDPFEFMPGGYSGDSPEERKRRVIEALCSSSKYRDIYNLFYQTSFSQCDWNNMINNNDPRIQEFISAELIDRVFDGLQRRDWEAYRERTTKDIVFCSFSQKANDILMWSHYAEEHTGIVIGFDSSCFDRLYKVFYSDKRVRLPLSSTVSGEVMKSFAEKVMTTKSSQWQYEEEWRRIISSNDVEKNGNLLLKSFPMKSVLSVYFGCRMSDAHKLQLQSIISRYPNPRVMQAKLHQRDFALEFVNCQHVGF